MTAPGKNWTLGNILATSSAYWQGCTLQAGVRLQLFTALAGCSQTVDELAGKLGVDRRGLEHLCNALTAMGLLCRSGADYRNSEAATTFLSKDSPTYKGHIILHHHNLVDAWAQLHTAVKQGIPVQERFTSEEEDRENFLLGMFNLAMDIAPRLVPQIDLTGRSHLLDLGGGPGTYAIHFCQANSSLTASIFDRSTTEPFARRIVDQFHLGDRIAFIPGDFTRDSISGGPYDVAWLSHILHSNGPEECQQLIHKTVAAMAPGGLILIHDFILENSKDAPLFPALFSLNMLVNNPEGRCYSEEEICAMLKEAGVRNISRHPFHGPNDSGVICGMAGEKG
ncbi:MAG: methyltransferase domain-containing protein [Proteobacteria bacterium]|nr:methyltransferase domain-containing protein [Pseudomonadota bacterium]